MSQSRFQEVKRKFNLLSQKKRDELLRDIYRFSNDTKLFFENRLLGGSLGEEFVKQMERETITKVYRMPPGDIDGRTVDGIISKAKKSGVNIWTIMKLEQFAYRGFIESLNEYGGGPETYDYMGSRHFVNYLKLVKQEIKEEQERILILTELKKYLEKKDNMYTDELDEIFEKETGMKVRR